MSRPALSLDAYEPDPRTVSRRTRAAFTVLVLALAAIAAAPTSARQQAPRGLTARNALEAGLLGQMNALRRQHGLAPLRLSFRLRAAADAHSSAMATRGFFAHESADGTAFWRRVQRYYPRTRYWSVGENLLWSSPDIDPAGALRMWLNSAPHRKNLLTARWREVGLAAVHVNSAPGVYGGNTVTILTADFGVRH
jgi:uncharacterized protein YkwD